MVDDAVPTLALAGVHGHGRTHLARAVEQAALGHVRFTAVADPRPCDDLPPGTVQHSDLDALLAAGVPDFVVLCTPIHTHAHLAAAALQAGADVLLEKPPAASAAELAELLAVERRTGRRVQVGFQSLGSDAVEHVRRRAAEGAVGEVTGYAAAGCWVRSARYWARTPWAGKRHLDGRVVADGVLTNPLAHAVATALAVAGQQRAEDVVAVTPDLFRVNDVEADDTSSADVALADGRHLLVACTLAAGVQGEPVVVVEGTRGRLLLHYTLDTVTEEVAGRLPLVTHHPRTDLLTDLLATARSGERPRSPLVDSGAFTRVLDAVVTAPPPTRVDPSHLRRVDLPDGDHRWQLVGVEEAVAQVLATRRTFSGLDLGWAGQAARVG